MTELPDEAIEAFFLGDAHDAWQQDEALARLDSDVLMGATGPAPSPSPALRAFLGSLTPVPPQRRRRHGRWRQSRPGSPTPWRPVLLRRYVGRTWCRCSGGCG